MAIRIRDIDGHIVALNARLTKEQEGDMYLDDAVHEALSVKFGIDFTSMGFMFDYTPDPIKRKLMKSEEWKCTCPQGKINDECQVHGSQSPELATNDF